MAVLITALDAVVLLLAASANAIAVPFLTKRTYPCDASAPFAIVTDQIHKNLLVDEVGVIVTDNPVISTKEETPDDTVCVSVLYALATCSTVPAGRRATATVPVN